MAVTLYRQVGKDKARRYQKINLGRGRRRAMTPRQGPLVRSHQLFPAQGWDSG